MSKWPEFYKTTPPATRDDVRPVYFMVFAAGAFVAGEGDERHESISIYDIWMEDRNGFGVEKVSREETPFDPPDSGVM